MSSVAITVPREYGYVLLTATATLALTWWHAVRTTPFRKAAGVPYPLAYADSGTSDAIATSSDPKAMEKYLFNCAQRSHQNYLENLPIFLGSLAIAGVKYPVASSFLGLGWGVSRVLYATGYTRKDKTGGQGRHIGSGYFVCQLALMVMSASCGWDLIMG